MLISLSAILSTCKKLQYLWFMKEKIMPIFDLLDFENNPLIQSDFTILVRKFKDGSWTTSQDNGKLIHELKAIEMEQEKYTKLFNHDKHKRKAIAALSGASSKLLLWIMAEIDSSQDWIWINVKRYMSENYITDIRTYKSSVSELIRYIFITEVNSVKYKDTYWINPRLFFCGDRIKKYPNNLQYSEQKKKIQVSEVLSMNS